MINKNKKIYTIQKTGKILKLQLVLSSLVVICSFVPPLIKVDDNILFYVFGIMFGLAWFIITRFLIWWNHS